MSSWQYQFSEFLKLVAKINKDLVQNNELRFGRNTIRVSDISEQYYCEKKLELQYLFGQVETEAKILGTKAHEKLLEDTTQIELSQIWKRIYSRKEVLTFEMYLLARYKSQFVVGRADTVFFSAGNPIFIFEFKFSHRIKPSKSHYVQSSVYAFLLREMGFDTSSLYCVNVIIKPEATKDISNIKKQVIDATIKNGQKEAELQIKDEFQITVAQIVIERFFQHDAKKYLDWVMSYWEFQRAAVRTEDREKCLVCEYKEKCDTGIQVYTYCNLTSIPLVGSERAKAFLSTGINTIKDVSNINPHDQVLLKRACFSWNCLKLIKNYAKAIDQNKIIVRKKIKLPNGRNAHFFDVEYDPCGTTTGPFGIFLIGILELSGEHKQYFLDHPKNECDMIRHFMDWFLKEKPVLIGYSSTSADKPQLLNALKRFNISTSGLENAFFDLYSDCINTQKARKQAIFLPMKDSMSLKEVTKYLGFKEPSLTISNGIDALSAYKQYLRTRNGLLKTDLKLYNLIDLERTKFLFEAINALSAN